MFEEYFIKNIENSLAFFAYLRYSLNIKCFDNQSIWMVHRMEPNLETVNDYLVSVFNDILTIEESELKKSQFNDLSITEMHTIEAIGMYKKISSSEVAKELSITVGTLTVAINNLVKKGYVERLRSEDDRRVVKLGLTKKGKLLFRVHQHFHREMVKNILKGMEQEEEQALLRALKNLHDFLQEYK